MSGPSLYKHPPIRPCDEVFSFVLIFPSARTKRPYRLILWAMLLIFFFTLRPEAAWAEKGQATYYNKTYGFSFLYSSDYNQTASCALKERTVTEAGLTVSLGNRITLTIIPNRSLTLEAVMAKEIPKIKEAGAGEIEVASAPMAIGKGKRLSYNMRGMGRLAQEYWVVHHTSILRFTAMSGTPGLPDRDELDNLDQVIQSLTAL